MLVESRVAVGPDDDQRQPFQIVDAQQVIEQGGRDGALLQRLAQRALVIEHQPFDYRQR
jgi:hypothetical protein